MANKPNISGRVSYSAFLLKNLGIAQRSPQTLDDIVNGYEAVRGLTGILDDGIEACTSRDGKLNTRSLASFILLRVMGNQK